MVGRWARMGALLLLSAAGTPAGQGAWTPTQNPMRTPRDAHAILVAGEKALIMGGRTKPYGATTTLTEVYDPVSGEIREAGRMIGSRSFFQPVLLDNSKVLAAGGYRQPNPHGTIRDCELYDPRKQRWKRTGAMQIPRELYAAVKLPNGDVLVIAGFSNGDITRTVERYETRRGRFRPAAGLQTARFGHTATLLDGRILVAGGRAARDISLTSTEIYDIGSGAWSAGPDMQEDRFRHMATRLADGRVLITGGYSSKQRKTLASAEIYDPDANTFTLLPAAMSDGRMDHTATLLPDGRVLIAGGWNSVKNRTVASVDIFDPATNAFAPAAPLPVSRHEQAAALLPTGAVLLTGGLQHEPSSEQMLNDALVYRP
ncbi:MAG TPA: kelch repeat-containing protein [Chthonomonadaceae bacterium]|nr:kelch repeat-containing protein [Chthonomonadaceae bacterium]